MEQICLHALQGLYLMEDTFHGPAADRYWLKQQDLWRQIPLYSEVGSRYEPKCKNL